MLTRLILFAWLLLFTEWDRATSDMRKYPGCAVARAWANSRGDYVPWAGLRLWWEELIRVL